MLNGRILLRRLGMLAGVAFAVVAFGVGSADAQTKPPPTPVSGAPAAPGQPCLGAECAVAPPPQAGEQQPCTGPTCIPQVPNSPTAPPGQQGDNEPWLVHLLTDWFWDFFADLASAALNNGLDLVARTILATPQLDQVPVVGQIWAGSQHIMIACWVAVVMVAGVVVMAYQTLQARASVKEVLPRLAVGFLAANLSLFVTGQAIEVANALTRAVVGGDPASLDQTARAFTAAIKGNGQGYSDVYAILTALVLAVMLLGVVVTYVVRVALTVILVIVAPLVLMGHALPQTEPIAFWWWKAFGGMLAIQIAQALTFVATVKIFYLPGGISLF